MRKFTITLIGLGSTLLLAVLAGILLTAFTGQAAWLWLLPGGLVLAATVLLELALWGSRGGLSAFITGQFPPHQADVPRALHLSALADLPEQAVDAEIDTAHPAGHIPPEFLSVAVDLSQVAGGKWWDPKADHVELSSGTLNAPVFDFDRPQLDRLVQALAPCVLRIGGSESDKIFYALDDNPIPPPGYETVLTRSQWLRILAFCRRNQCQLMFTLNAGPSARRSDGAWNPNNAEALMAFTAQSGGSVEIWELGNELNIFFFVHGLRQQVTMRQYAADLGTLRGLMAQHSPGALLAGQGSAYMPVLGEPLGIFFGATRGMLERAGSLLDLITWHYYPQQSRRCPFGTRRAHPARLLDPRNLDEAGHWAGQITALRDRFAPNRPVWLGETGNAQCGGAPGLSETFIAGLWWLDELGLMARLGQQGVVRQSLTGMNYGLLDEATLAPRPDYWNTLLWRRLMGSTVLPVKVRGTELVRAYAHEAADGKGVTVLALNLSRTHRACLRLPQFNGSAEAYHATAPDVLGSEVRINGAALTLQADGSLPEFTPQVMSLAEGLELPPLAYAFYVIRR